MRKILLIIVLAGFTRAYAQDRIFTYTYQTGVLNKGQKELEVTSTFANGRENFYRGSEHRLEFEIGLGGKLQTAFYLNYGYSTTVEEVDGIESLNSDTEYSFSNEWKLKLSDPVADRIGSAIYFEYTLAPTETELEGKIILDKQTGNLVNALNLVGEYGSGKKFISNGTKLEPEKEGELVLELNYGLSYKTKVHLNIGLEVFNQNQIAGSKWESSVLSLGPCLSYSGNNFWINLTFMPQIADLKGGGLELTEHEKLQTRLIFSYEF